MSRRKGESNLDYAIRINSIKPLDEYWNSVMDNIQESKNICYSYVHAVNGLVHRARKEEKSKNCDPNKMRIYEHMYLIYLKRIPKGCNIRPRSNFYRNNKIYMNFIEKYIPEKNPDLEMVENFVKNFRPPYIQLANDLSNFVSQKPQEFDENTYQKMKKKALEILQTDYEKLKRRSSFFAIVWDDKKDEKN